MAIARVRIAPEKQWCEGALEAQVSPVIDYRPLIGHPVEVLTHNVSASALCDGKRWQLKESYRGIDTYLCEHMLEMD